MERRKRVQVTMEKNEIFHVHTFRCGHAAEVEDEAYVKKAIELGADKITFTDHAPFPGDFFAWRMKCEQLDGYLTSIRGLQEKYAGRIEVRCGLEIEYLPTFKNYYEELRASEAFDVLLLGQHIFEYKPGLWNYEVELSDEVNAMGLFEAQIKGLETGYFDVLAHPDRCLQKMGEWTREMNLDSKELIRVARERRIPLEKNLASMESDGMYRKPFWANVGEGDAVIIGYDAHAPEEMERRHRKKMEIEAK
ncbi:MAG: PHP domain-containing protein [Lachnospiraceae bacterium]|nr:PHP domain-containing protein [Lachnospiraceae bacterium]